MAAQVTVSVIKMTPQKKEQTTMIPEKFKEIMKKDGVVAIATLGEDGPHMVNTWNSYMRVSEDFSKGF